MKIWKLHNYIKVYKSILILAVWLTVSSITFAQGNATAGARIDAAQITVGDELRLFIEVQNNTAKDQLQWAVIPDTFNTLEVKERGKIDTIKQGDITIYKQRLVITGFDSGIFQFGWAVFAARC